MNTHAKQHPQVYKLVVSHYLISALCFLALATMLLFSINELGGHYFHPKLLAITHTAALGWGTLIIFGACYQLLPVILETDLFSYKLAWLSLFLFIPGLILLVFSFWIFDPGVIMQAGSLLLLVGIVMFACNVFSTAQTARKKNIYHDFITTSCIWLIATAALGVLMVFNFRYPFLQKDHLQFLKIHAHMGIGGWFLLLIVGVSSKLIPMFLVSTKQKSSLLTYSYYLINLALLLFLIDTYLNNITIKTYLMAGLAFAGVFCWLRYIFFCIQSRMRKVFDLPIWHTLLSFALLLLAIIVLPFLIFYELKSNPNVLKGANLYGMLLFMGWISALILGQTYKTLPFISWIKHYQHLAGKSVIPMPADLFNKTVLRSQLIAFALFNAVFYLGLIYESQLLLQAGLICFLITAFFYLANVLLIILHKPKSTLYGKS